MGALPGGRPQAKWEQGRPPLIEGSRLLDFFSNSMKVMPLRCALPGDMV